MKGLRIAILGWGSLIWDPRNLPREGVWHTGGPVFPIEFSRISVDCRLTLVIDPANGVPVITRYVQSPRADLDDAVSDLCEREGTATSRIGFVDLPCESRRCEVHPPLVPLIRAWSAGHGFDAVVWTDLCANFEDEMGQPFSVERAEAYLLRLPKSAADRARRYISNAPPEVDTPLRRRLREAGWLSA